MKTETTLTPTIKSRVWEWGWQVVTAAVVVAVVVAFNRMW